MPAAATDSDGRARGYLALVRDNAAFRRLWLAQIVSQLGDWFDYVAVPTLLLELTGSGTAAAGMLVARFLPVSSRARSPAWWSIGSTASA